MKNKFMEEGTKFMLASAQIVIAFDTKEERLAHSRRWKKQDIVYEFYTIITTKD